MDHISESLETIFGVKFFDADPDLGPGTFFTLDPGWKNLDPGPGMENSNPGSTYRIRNTACG
jgi:hypothetical protein